MDPPANGTDSLDDVMEVVRNDMEPFVPPIASGVPPSVFTTIIEQPAPKALRFRYECEGRSAGSIPGKSSTADVKTFPAIQVHGWTGRAVVLVSCVSKDPPYRPHPHNLVGKEPSASGAPQCKDGVCSYEMQNASLPATFPNLGIQCVKRKDIEEALKLRQRKKVDPFRTNFGHINQPSSIDLNCVRLCFQVFLEGPERNKFMFPLKPVVSDPIYDKKATADLVICKLSHSSASALGGTEVILLCEKVTKEDIAIRFYEEDAQEQVIWESYADFSPSNVHKQVAITFKTPRYRTIEISEPVTVWIELRRPTDGESSARRAFQFYPIESGRPPFWSLRKMLFTKQNLPVVSNVISADKSEESKLDEVPDIEIIPESKEDNSTDSDVKLVEVKEECPVDDNSVIAENDTVIIENNKGESLVELLEQVKDLEQMFPESETCGTNCADIYTSLQLAMKNPMIIGDSYEDVPPPRPTQAKPVRHCPMSDDILPPLPPKRAKKMLTKNLPPIPEKTKMSLFQKLFSSKKKKTKSLQGSTGSRGSSKTINSETLIERGEMDLTEAEHYALYTHLAPRATLSECDEMSFYYSPAEPQPNMK